MTTSSASTASIPFAAVETARKSAAAKSQSTWAARVAAGEVNDTDWVKKGQATRAALAAEREQAIADAPIRRAKLSVQSARRFDREAAHMAQVAARLDRLNRMREAARLVNLLGLRADGTIVRRVLEAEAKKRGLL